MHRKDLILLHGALGSAAQLQALQNILSEDFNCHTLNFDGHGGKSIKSNFSIEHFTDNLTDFIKFKDLKSPAIFGYSMGGYVSLNAASQGVELERIVTLGTKFDWNPDGSQKEVEKLNPEVIEQKIPKYAEYQSSLHSPEDWKVVMNNTAEMMLNLGSNPVLSKKALQKINIPVLCCRGSNDNMVSKEETVSVIQELPNANYVELVEFQHPIEKVKTEVLANVIRDFLK